MRIDVDPGLIEKAVFLACRGDEALECELHKAVDPLYVVRDDPGRERAFHAVFLDGFYRLGLHAQIADLLAERPELNEGVARCLVREAPSARDEAVEVLAPPQSDGEVRRTLVIQVTPQRLASGDLCCDAMRREMLHAADIVDPRFAFRRDDLVGGTPQANLIRDRYHVLWRAFVEGRLRRQHRLARPGVDSLVPAARRAFSGMDAAVVERCVAGLLERDDVTHEALLAAAEDPSRLPVISGIGGDAEVSFRSG